MTARAPAPRGAVHDRWHVPCRDAAHLEGATMNAPTRVDADDHPMYRFGLNAALTIGGEIDDVAEATTGLVLLDRVDRDEPDVELLLLDVDDERLAEHAVALHRCRAGRGLQCRHHGVHVRNV